MTDLITAEDAKKLLDGSTPGPWEWTTGRFSNNPYLSPNILLLAFDGGGPDGVDPNDAANARLIAAAPDLARTVIALHAQLAEAVEAERERQEARFADLLGAAHGLSYGEDWNNGTHAKTHGYREKLLAAVADLMGDMASQQATAIRTALATQEAGK